MKRLVFVAVIGLLAGEAHAGEADPRAVAACKASSTTFVQVADCLPGAHLAFKTFDAFDKIYPPAAAPLKTKCIELNKGDIAGASACVTEAVHAALKLKSSLPKGTSLGDPVFDAVSDAALKEQLDAATEKAKEAFPDQRVWGAILYYRYK